MIQANGPNFYWPDWGALVIALVALVQPWVITLWKRYIRRGEVEIYETGNMEIGLSAFGPTVALMGTLRALHQDVFITHVELTTIRKRDNAEQVFSWRAFRPNAIQLDQDSPSTLEAASGFLLSPAGPFKYNMFFTSDRFIAEHAAQANRVTQLWDAFVRNSVSQNGSTSTQNVEETLKNPVSSRKLFDEFLTTDEPRAFLLSLNDDFYWFAGEYELEMTVETSDEDREFQRNWKFSLEKVDSDQLRSNSMAILNALCGMPKVFNFAYPQYEEVEEED